MLTIKQKNAWAKHPCATEMAVGRKKSTVMPPNSPWASTVPRAARPRYLNPSPGFFPPEPNRENHRQQPHGCRHHAVAMFIENASDHRWHQRAIGKWPVRYRQTGFITGNQRSGNDQKPGANRCEDRKTMKSNSLRCFLNLHMGSHLAESRGMGKRGTEPDSFLSGKPYPFVFRSIIRDYIWELCKETYIIRQFLQDAAFIVKSTVFDSLAATVTFCVSVPSFSCQASMVYSPGGKPLIS